METITEFLPILNTQISPNLNIESYIEIIFFILLIFSSAMVSGSEVAYFSLTPDIIEDLENGTSKKEKKVVRLINNPNKLLATILITNNFVNIAIVVLATHLTGTLIDFNGNTLLKFLIEAVVVTFIILLFGEIIPKIYANKLKKSFALAMALPLSTLEKVFYPLVVILEKSTNIVNKRLKNTNALSMSDLSDAIDITASESQNEKKILKNVVTLNTIEVRNIMTPRVDVVNLSIDNKFSVVKKIINQSGFSRIPVFEDELDKIVGILYIKDLIPFLKKDNYFEWQKYIRQPYFIPENKKIDDLLQEFRNLKTHLAIVSDEYGGFSGIVTLEDVIEEIVGEINDEFDVEENMYSKISDNQSTMEGKLLLKDFQRLANLDDDYFDDENSDAETIAGLLLNIIGDFPKPQQKIKYKDIEFEVIKINNRRIVKVKATFKNNSTNKKTALN